MLTGPNFFATVGYTLRIRARGETMKGRPFEREQTLTAVAVPGGDRWSPEDPQQGGLCELLDCLRRTGALDGELLRRSKELGIDLEALIKCLDRKCRQPADEGRGKGTDPRD